MDNKTDVFCFSIEATIDRNDDLDVGICRCLHADYFRMTCD